MRSLFTALVFAAGALMAPVAHAAPPAAPAKLIIPVGPKVPSAPAVLALLRNTLIAVDQGNKTGNYTVLRDLGTPAFREANTPAKLGLVFANLVEQGVDMLPVLVVEPQYREPPRLTVRAGMEIDFGGIGKEYAVDPAAALMAADSPCPVVVNFGGDVVTLGPRRDGDAWRVGIDDPARPGEATLYRVDIERGGLATSGDARRFVMHEGRRLSHILDPRTGWPVENAPRAVTVLAATCVEAGTLATLALLHGAGAGAFLRAQGVAYRIV